MDTRGLHVFISHGSENRPEAAALCDFLESKGIRTWIAPRDVRPGTDYSEELQAAIETSLAFVVLISEKSNKSPYVRAETEIAFSTGTPIYPVRNSDIQPAAGLAFFLKIRHWTDAFGEGRDAALARLVRELQVLSAASAEAAVLPEPAPPEPPPPPPPPPLYPTTPAAPVLASPAPPSNIYAEGWASTPPTATIPPAPAYAPPAEAPIGGEAEQELRAYIGPNADYFLVKWRQSDATNKPNSWNWAAFFLTVFWLAYRKMWGPMAIGSGALFALRIVGGLAPPLALLTTLLSLGVAGWIGWSGNALYRKAVNSAVAEAHRTVTPPHSPIALLQLRGGVSLPAALGLVAGFVVATVIVAALMIRHPGTSPVAPAAPVSAPTSDTPSSGEPDKPN